MKIQRIKGLRVKVRTDQENQFKEAESDKYIRRVSEESREKVQADQKKKEKEEKNVVEHKYLRDSKDFYKSVYFFDYFVKNSEKNKKIVRLVQKKAINDKPDSRR